ncbi:unnamed protein product [Peniophora sp. CBMAI 1063]|nr:unnamed protein product [Peniophora sp. CBMAI 1063]
MNGASASTPPRKTQELPSSSLLTPTPAHNHNHAAHSPGPSPRPSTSSASLSTAAREPISSAGLLQTHNGNTDAALEAAVNERNSLSAENRQLWRLLEKSRGAYGDAIKNLERVRGERDAYKSRLQHLGENTDAVARAFRERERKMRKEGDKPAASSSMDSNGTGKLTPEWGMPRAIAAPPRSSSVPMTAASTSSHGPAISISTQGQAQQGPGSGGSPLSAHESPQSLRPNTHQLRHESRIELPAEAREYIQSMTESPLPSPRAPQHPQVTRVNDDRDVTASPVPTLEIEEPEEDAELGARTSDEQADTIKSRRTTESAPVSPADELPPHLNNNSIDLPRQRSDSRGTTGSSASQEQVVYSRRPLPLDTPTTPTANSYNASQSTLNTPVTAVPAAGAFSTPISAPNNGVPSSSSASTSMSNLTPSSSAATITSTAPSSLGTASGQAAQGTPQFRALPLLPHDLPRTKVSVTASTIRPNDRGKDVLSFVVSVDPGNGKDSWSVEKLYSDVAALDVRVRAGYGRSVSKKLPHLPDGKLWRDHAPSRVDQRKAVLEAYLGALISLPVKSNDEAIAFLTSDIVRSANRPVWRAGYKEGYLTKRGKNFGGWKTRFFVLQGPMLEYYESRGGTHLGVIPITGAQIGRQQKPQDRRETEEESEYRHAFLVIEARGSSATPPAQSGDNNKARAGSGHRHVLCAESDAERDAWVDMLVRYVSGTYNDGDLSAPAVSLAASPSPSNQGQPRSSTSSEVYRSQQSGEYARGPQTEFVRPDVPSRAKPTRGMSKDDISVANAVPLSKLAPDASNAKLFASTSSLDDTSMMDGGYTDAQNAQRILQGKSSPAGSLPDDAPLSASLPASSPLAGAEAEDIPLAGPRSNSELGHYPHLSPPGQQPTPSSRREKRQSYHPQLNVVPQGATPPRDPSPRPQRPVHPAAAAVAAAQAQQQAQQEQQQQAQSKVKISGPVAGSGAPIPAGYKFGAAETPPPGPSQAQAAQPKADSRREKAKSRLLWGWNKGASSSDKEDKGGAGASKAPARAVFGVTLEESLDVASVVGLPAVVFRCIQYLEAKKAHEEEGIYRLSGSSSVVKALKDRFNAEGDVDLLAADEHWDLHAIAGLLKTFFRDLPSTILTSQLHMRFMRVMDYVSAEERLTELTRLIRALPLANYSLLRALSAHLILIVDNNAQNKMTMRNVGIVFSPTLGIPAGVFGLMLGAFNRVFDVDDPNGGAPVEVEPVQDERRNSRQYTDAAADRLLGLSGRTLSRGAGPGIGAPRATPEAEADTDTDDDNELELSVHDESGTEGTATDAEDEAAAAKEREGRARALAAGRGLSINTAESKRASRLPPGAGAGGHVGLPSSPRPTGSPFNPAFPGQGAGGQQGAMGASLQVPR